MLNKFTDGEAIERVIAIRDNLALDLSLPLPERWADKDALAQVINLAKLTMKGGKDEDNK